ncbi:MAG: hypothetical protein JWN22_3296 [Nocardioides sp.]|jgi:hypothetical protein|nr:hypothetical protein [Nocardioides sp.]
MKTTNPFTTARRARGAVLGAGLLTAAAILTGCSGSATPSNTPSVAQGAGSTASPAADSPVLPVKTNPITNNSAVQALQIDSVLVENNVDSAGKATSDHLEIALTNTGAADLTAFEVYYAFDDPKTAVTESYYAKLPDTFTIAAGGQRVAHFDNTGATDHFAVNDFSLYYTDTNALDVTVEVSAVDTATQTALIKKDAGGAETAD